MTAVLAKRTSALRSRLEALDHAASNVAEVSALEGLRASLTGKAEKLGSGLAKQKLLATANIVVPSPASLMTVQKQASILLEKFLAEPKAETLKKLKGWGSLLSELETATRDLTSTLVSTWKAHRQSVFAGETPSQIRSKLARTSDNDEALQKYELSYTRLREAFDNLPADAQAITATAKIADDLERIAKGFNFDVPAEVKQFLEAVLSVKGASLSFLTPEVLNWLRDSGGIDNYSVKATGRS